MFVRDDDWRQNCDEQQHKELNYNSAHKWEYKIEEKYISRHIHNYFEHKMCSTFKVVYIFNLTKRMKKDFLAETHDHRLVYKRLTWLWLANTQLRYIHTFFRYIHVCVHCIRGMWCVYGVRKSGNKVQIDADGAHTQGFESLRSFSSFLVNDIQSAKRKADKILWMFALENELLLGNVCVQSLFWCGSWIFYIFVFLFVSFILSVKVLMYRYIYCTILVTTGFS